MTIAYVSSTVSAATAVATAVPVAYPASVAASDGLVLIVGTKQYDAAITTPAGWSALGEVTNGTTATGIDVGSVKAAAFFEEAAGGETGNLTVAISGSSSSWAVMLRYTKSAAAAWLAALATGTDTVVGTAWSVAFGSNPGIQGGDHLVLGGVQSTDAANTWSAHSLTAAGATIATPVGQQNPRITTGNDSGGHVATSSCSAGTASTAPTWTATQTLAVNNAGSAVLVRLRELLGAANVPAPYIVGRQARRQAIHW